ncbi:MAG: ATP phosphoribosyltransferase regulatory subunit [Chroococcidiopsidaceae cyanobacterium CP_BM_RX_35]|nr:ATP phosphoribosyltransferase regulatory subunit [Chroococcidiopsidaceae cyanobacterium CP_BM_RX_35]
MVYQPPAGARDLLPLDVAQKCWIEERLQQVFDRWGYHRIITSTLERLDTLMAGGAIQRSTVIQLQDAQEEELGLRPELTASIARTAVTRMAGITYPQRLYYHANVFCRTKGSSLNRQQEFYQSGVELLGSSGFLADAEILLVLAECLNHLGLSEWCLVLGEAGIARSLLSTFPETIQDKVRQAIAHLDRVTIDTLPLSPELRERARIMLDLRGRPADVLQQVGSLKLDFPQKEALNHLKSLVSLLNESFSASAGRSTASFPLILDLSLLQTIDYYTGIVFEVVSNTKTQPQILGRGGRYDQLLGLYHPQGATIPGIGFMLNIEDLHQVLLSNNQLPQAIPVSNWLVVPQTPQAYAAAFSYAEKLRNSIHLVRVEIDLGGRNPSEIREYARRRCIQQIAWIKTTGSPIIEPVNEERAALYTNS